MHSWEKGSCIHVFEPMNRLAENLHMWKWLDNFYVFPKGVWQSSVTAGAANVWRDRQRTVWGERRWSWDSPRTAGRVSAVGHTLPSSSVFYPQFSTNLLTFFSCSIYCRCVSGLWGLKWCVPVMRASSGMLLQTRAAWRTCQQPKGAVRGAHRKIRALESKSQCALIWTNLNDVLLLLCLYLVRAAFCIVVVSWQKTAIHHLWISWGGLLFFFYPDALVCQLGQLQLAPACPGRERHLTHQCCIYHIFSGSFFISICILCNEWLHSYCVYDGEILFVFKSLPAKSILRYFFWFAVGFLLRISAPQENQLEINLI